MLVIEEQKSKAKKIEGFSISRTFIKDEFSLNITTRAEIE